MTIALVGFTNSYNDQQWLAMAGAWVAEHDPAMPWSAARRTVFDLRGENGSNFLDDRGEYDVVVLFAIYNPPMESVEFQRALGRRQGQTSLAVNHSRENWALRLSRTMAKYLLVFRRPDSVDGEWLGEIERYEKQPERAGVFGMSIYRHAGRDGNPAVKLNHVNAVVGTRANHLQVYRHPEVLRRIWRPWRVS